MDFVIIPIVALLASLLTFFSGFGLGTLLMPVFAIFYPVEIAVALTGVVHLLNNLFKIALVYKNINLEIASEYLLMATWLAYLKSKLLLPGTPDEEFKIQEVAEKLKLQLKKLELIRLLSEQMLKRKRLGREIRSRGMKGNIRSIYSGEYRLNLFELLKSYSSIIMTKDFQKMNIPKLPVFTAEDGIKTIKDFLSKLIDWKNLNDLIPSNFKNGKNYQKTGKAGIFAGSLELVKEGNLIIKQDKLFANVYIKENS